MTEIEQARADERKRIGEILGSTAAAGRETLSAHIAFKTDIRASEAIEMLRATPMIAEGSTTDTNDQGTTQIDANAIFEKRAAAAKEAR